MPLPAPYAFTDKLRRQIKARLAAFDRIEGPGKDGKNASAPLKRAAVALTLCAASDGNATFILTERAFHLSAHAGQFALPGGRIDPGESEVTAALRELREEMGLVVHKPAVLGKLDDYVTRSGYIITPVVVWADPPAKLTPNPKEVARALIVPLTEMVRADSPQYLRIPQSDRPVIRMPMNGEGIHAPTAAPLFQFREVVLLNRFTRVDHLEEPVFAWS